MIKVERTNSKHKDFIKLVDLLNAYLKITDGEEHSFYNQFNGLEQLNHVILVYDSNKPVACGAFKAFDNKFVEIKRMYTIPESRKKGLASNVINHLESWAKELKFSGCILETGKRQIEAVQFYKKIGYQETEKYGPYKNMDNSICFKKEF